MSIGTAVRRFFRGELDDEKAQRAHLRAVVVDVATGAEMFDRTVRFASLDELSKTIVLPARLCSTCTYSMGEMCSLFNMPFSVARDDRRRCDQVARNWRKKS